MKTLAKGRKQTGWATETVCTGEGHGGGGCGAKLLVDTGDLFYMNRSLMGGETERYVTFECQECESLNRLKDVPKEVSIRHESYNAWSRRDLDTD